MSTVQGSYDRNADIHPEILDADRALAEMQDPGSRYYCEFDQIAELAALNAVE